MKRAIPIPYRRPRESGGPGATAGSLALGSRFRGNDGQRIDFRCTRAASSPRSASSRICMAAPDGLALDVEGCLLIAHEGFGSVWRLSPHAEPLDRIVSCAARATMNLAFGGPDNARLFITESQTGSILQADLSVALADCSFASRSPLAAPGCFRCFLQRNISRADNCQIRHMRITIVT
jgi:SMP-30/Gluconolactonase/LRE-like region